MDQQRPLLLLTFCLLFILVCMISGCSNEESAAPAQPEVIKGFSFFDLGANSHYSSAVRQKLGEKLGSDAISQQNVIDLTLYSAAFFKKHFPQLFNLNRELNLPEGQRIEHNTTKLMYRYARLKETPFKDITLYFSNDTGKPLFFKYPRDPAPQPLLKPSKRNTAPLNVSNGRIMMAAPFSGKRAKTSLSYHRPKTGWAIRNIFSVSTS
jgi:hypothetical protein